MDFVRGHRLKAAVGCWYTSTGKVLIQMVKYEDENGMRHVIRDIQVTGTTILQPAYYIRYDCRAEFDGRMKDFVLFHHFEKNIWEMVVT